MSIHVAGPLADTKRVQEVQSAVVSLPDHKLTRDSSRGPDVTFAGQWIPAEVSAELAAKELNAVMTAESVLVWHPNTMDVEGSSSLELRLPGLGTVTLSTLLSSARFDTKALSTTTRPYSGCQLWTTGWHGLTWTPAVMQGRLGILLQADPHSVIWSALLGGIRLRDLVAVRRSLTGTPARRCASPARARARLVGER